MTVAARFGEVAEKASQRYDALIASWRALYQDQMNRIDFGKPSNFRMLREEAYAGARRYLDEEKAIIDREVLSFALEARTDALKQMSANETQDTPEALDELVADTASYLLQEITIQLERDISHMMHTMRKAVLQVGMSSRVQQVPMKSALIQHRITQSNSLQFFFHTRSAAKWPSRRFIRSLWRQVLVSIYNETIMIVLADHGEDRAVVDHPNTDYHAYGRVIALFDGSSMPTYTDVRAELFHPNSDATLKRAA